KLVFLLCCLAFATLVFAQLEEQVEVRLMEIWVKVTDNHDHPITDLGMNDFQLFIDGKKSELRCFDHSNPDSSIADSDIEDSFNPPTKGGRKYFFYFDLLNTQPGDFEYLKKKFVDYVHESFRPPDQAMIFALLPSMRLGVVQKMTTDKESIISTVNKMKGNPSLLAKERTRESQLLDVLYPGDTTQENQPSASTAAGPRFMDTFHTARMMARSFAAEEKQQSRLTAESFLTIANYMGSNSFDGRLILVYISGGFSMKPGMQYHQLVQDAIEKQQGILTGDFRLIEYPSSDFQSEVRNVIGKLNRLNVTIYAIDTKGAISFDRSPDRINGASKIDSLETGAELQDSLFFLAQETGGTAFINNRSYDRALANIRTDMDEQYLLCADVPVEVSKGYHQIKVKVNRPDVNVRHRKGFSG
ncbi:MAG TPA: VWA domain-containing protein, partial [Acidobacteriota bacterium]